jgi:hypothetical protein
VGLHRWAACFLFCFSSNLKKTLWGGSMNKRNFRDPRAALTRGRRSANGIAWSIGESQSSVSFFHLFLRVEENVGGCPGSVDSFAGVHRSPKS